MDEIEGTVKKAGQVDVVGRGGGVTEVAGDTYERTNRSRLTQSGFFGLKVINLLNRT